MMTTEQYHEALRRLGLSHASKRTMHALGLSRRQCVRIAQGYPVSPRVERLLQMYLDYGVPGNPADYLMKGNKP